VKAHFSKNAFLAVVIAQVFSSVGFCRAFAAESASVKPQAVVMGNPTKTPEELKGVGVREHLGEPLSLSEIALIDPETQQKRPLSTWFQNGKPVLLNLVYFECPMLCTMVLNGVNEGMKKLTWSVGEQFNVVTISINPNDTPSMALAKKQNYLNDYLKVGHDAEKARLGWAFLTAEEAQVRKLASQLGFEYKYDEIQKQYAHSAVTFVLTPEGKISRYLYGITYAAKDLKLALLEASQGKIGSVFDRLLLFCYHYEPLSRGYSLQAMKVMQLGAMGMVAFLGGYLMVFWSRQRKGNAK
jgi:protein SCO1/2